MSEGTFLRFYHKADIYKRTVVVNDAGQRTLTYSFLETIPVVFQAMASERRTGPYIANIDEYQMYVPYKYNEYISYDYQVNNIIDRYGNVLETGPMEIIAIQKKMGFSGRLHHIFVTIRRAVESA